ncbi:MAG: hypothetical protein ABJA66_13220 [Actinomycetota bacterium]
MKFTNEMNNEHEDLLGKIVNLMQTDKSADAPADSIRWSKNLFRAHAAAPKKSLVRRVLAVLQMDLSPDKAVFGERSASPSEVRQMLFGAGNNSIDLRITKAKIRFTIAGQILGEDFTGAEIELANAEKSFKTKANKISEFKFENISKGKYTLSLTLKDKEIVIENIEIS